MRESFPREKLKVNTFTNTGVYKMFEKRRFKCVNCGCLSTPSYKTYFAENNKDKVCSSSCAFEYRKNMKAIGLLK